jgi:hypothetical protein
MTLNTSSTRRLFHIRCDAGTAGHLDVGTDSLSVIIAQKTDQSLHGPMWESVQIHCKELQDGSVTVRIAIHHPHNTEPVSLASLQSFPLSGDGMRRVVKYDLLAEADIRKAAND